MKLFLLGLAALFLFGNAAALLAYRTIVRGSYLFVTAGTVLMPLVAADILLGSVCLVFVIADWVRRARE
jgi:hypothetical protein